jgi:hypothetical protein
MSHIVGTLGWSEAVLMGSRIEGNQLVLELADGTTRHMNVKNWEASNRITANKASAIKSGTRVRIAAWNGYDASKWFCDVDPA